MNTISPVSTIPAMTKEEFDFFRAKLFELAGISLSDVKLDLLQARLRSRVTDLGFSGYDEYRDHLDKLSADDSEWEAFVNQLTTNKTDWFREPEHFNYLVKDFLPKWKTLGKKHLSVWCAASSTGEEPYTLSMVLWEALKGTGITYEILASDIDTKVLTLARNGVYPRERLYQIPENYQRIAVALGSQEISHWMKIKKEIKENVKFVQLNLTRALPLKDKFDIIFCRNVLIYFNSKTVEIVANSLHERALDQSALIISHSESLQSCRSKWVYRSPSIYAKGSLF
jgi:chemotaxis protein methyltransferase CheR